jgi:hypothetical protein
VPEDTPRGNRLEMSLIVPLRAAEMDAELLAHLGTLTAVIDDVILVDSSPEPVFRGHAALLEGGVHHLRPQVELPMGKVANVRAGLEHARHDRVVVADDDVRWHRELLEQALTALDEAEVVRPANYFAPERWHTRWDTGRALIARATGGDWPGTMVVRRSMLPRHGYAGDCLFENLELVRTVRARGGREVVLDRLLVPRRPPTTTKFFEQRIRQAYDELARPHRLALQLALAPAIVLGGRRALVAGGLAAVVLAEAGRRRAGGSRVWPWTASLWAPLWVLERSLTAWLAVLQWCTGGARLPGGRVRRAAHPERALAPC